MERRLTLWHNRRDTLLRIVDGRLHDREKSPPKAGEPPLPPLEGPAPYYSVYIPIGISPGDLRRHNITLEYDLDLDYAAAPVLGQIQYQHLQRSQNTAMRVGLDQENARGAIRRITPDLLAHLRYQELHDPEPRHIRPYLEIERVFKLQTERRRPAFYEAALHYIPAGAKLRYRVKVYEYSRPATILPMQPTPSIAGTAAPSEPWYAVYALAPTFERKDIFYCASDVGVPDVNVGYAYKTPAADTGSTEDLVTFRFDFVDVQRAINDFEISFQPPGESAPEASRLSFVWLVDTPHLDLMARSRPISETWPLDVLPIVNAQFDYVTLTVPRSSLPKGTTIIWRGEQIAQVQRGTPMLPPLSTIKPIRLLFMHYANQSLNDLFESPNKNYSPSRSYIQTTMRDELGTFSSRPNANESGIGDGYHFVFEQHQKYRLPGVFAMNGGFLAMLAQDDPEQFALVRQGIEAGDFEPAIGGWAGHRMLYVPKEANTAALQYGIFLMESLLPGTSRTFHPNSRLYAATSNIDHAIAAARIRRPLVRQNGGRALTVPDGLIQQAPTNVQFVVIDQSAFRAYTKNEKKDLTPHLRARPNADLWGENKHCYIWRQPCPVHPKVVGQCPPGIPGCRSWYWLIIDKKMKDDLFSASEDEWRAGKLPWQLRYHFFYGVSVPKIAEDCLLVYGDDCDKAAGNGWFDGDYNGNESNNAAKFAAALEWIAAHPWLEVVRTADLDPDQEYVGDIEIGGAIDPSIHEDRYNDNGIAYFQPHWSAANPLPGPEELSFEAWARAQMARNEGEQASGELGFEYARWFLNWNQFCSPWLRRTLGAIDQALGARLMVDLTDSPGFQLRQLAQLAYLMSLHEAHWSKKPLESHMPARDFESRGFGGEELAACQRDVKEEFEPENFVLALSLQARNAHVFWCAAQWAELCGLGPAHPDAISEATYKDSGPLIERIRQLKLEAAGGIPEGAPDVSLYWDLDVTPNVILYNGHLLVVMDENGGRITHIFARAADGRAVVVSGNIKAYQFLGDDRRHAGQLPCNGSVFQNTVFVPNHQYVATDVLQSGPTAGTRFNPKTKIVTKRRNDRTAKVAEGPFGDEDWLYPDNFNHYARVPIDAQDTMIWEYPGHAWRLESPTSAAFDAALAAYRAYLLKLDNPPAIPDGCQRPVGEQFQKTITLEGSRLKICYKWQSREAPPDVRHVVANEFSLDLYQMLTENLRQERRWIWRDGEQPAAAQGNAGNLWQQVERIAGCEFRTAPGKLAVRVLLDEHSRFSIDTLDGDGNRRLHRAYSDCLEIESREGQAFSYIIEVATPTTDWPAPTYPQG